MLGTLCLRASAGTLALLLLLGAGRAEAQGLVNGNFEMGTTGAVGSSTTAVTGWTTTVGSGGNADVYHGNNGLESWVPTAQNGSYCLQLDGSSSNNDQNFLAGAQTKISQTFTLISAGTYQITFYLSGEAGTTKVGTVGVLVSLSGVAITAGTLTNKEFTISNSGATTGSWTAETASFTVSDASQPITLTFADDNTHTGTAGAYTSPLANYVYSSNAAIDDITIVPEPGTWALVGLGLTGVCLAALRRRKQDGAISR